MRSSINCILTGIAVSDVFTMMSYIPFAIHFYLVHGVDPTKEKYSYDWTMFLIIHIQITSMMHTTSIWLAVFMAILRYKFLASGGQYTNNLDQRSTCLVIFLIYVASALTMIPNFVITGIEPQTYNNETLYRLKSTGLATGNPYPMTLIAFWLYATLGKLIPCCLITIFGGLLLHTLWESKKRTASLRNASSGHRMRQHARTTRMLLVVIVLFLMTELPQGIMVIVCLYVPFFFLEIYMRLGDLLDMVALINNAINFILYCTMSQQFRNTLVSLFSKCIRSNNAGTEKERAKLTKGTKL